MIQTTNALTDVRSSVQDSQGEYDCMGEGKGQGGGEVEVSYHGKGRERRH